MTISGGCQRCYSNKATRITSAQLKTLNTLPISLVAAPGAGFAILPMSISLVYNFLTAAYTNVNNPSITWGTSNSNPGWDYPNISFQLNNVQNLFLGAASFFVSGAVIAPDVSTSPVALSVFANQPITFNDTQAWASGSGSAIITVVYVTVPTV